MRLLLSELIDYAGLFPPASLSMREVVANYASYRASPDAWMLGRLVIPAGRLTECHSERSEESDCWRVSALVANVANDAATLRAWNEPGLIVDSVELKASSVTEIQRAAESFRDVANVFVEIPVSDDPAPLLDAIAAHQLKAKIRTGGITADAFPDAHDVARFLVQCSERRLPFKATAGLHHPLQGTYRLTYDENAPRGAMFGFLNVFCAAMAARAGDSAERVVMMLETRDVSHLDFHDERWHVDDVRHHREFALSFGSCSFTEPVNELRHLGLM